ncbi:hypothetical protein DRO33_06720 [Candidatus Bathyarchaeota archaeon]|nr:MAG: hypothetical protein DRO33_06720 [Candidatus Bathyarchaeota archaeon]
MLGGRGSSSQVCYDMPDAFSRQLAGYPIRDYSFELPFFICAAFYSASTALFYVFFRREGGRAGAGEPQSL